MGSHGGQWKCNDKLLTLQPNKKYRLRMVFKKKTVSVMVNGKAACTNIPRSDRKVFKNVQVYVGDPWYAPADAKVENLYFKDLKPKSGGGAGGGGSSGGVKGAKMLGGTGNIKKGTKLKSMNIPLDYEIGLDITPNNKIEKNWANIVHFTATGKDCCGYGSRIPGVWFWPGTRKLLVVDGHTKNGNSHTGEWKCDDKLLTLQANKKYRLRMVFKRKKVSVMVNGQSACKNIPRSDRKVFKNVQVYVGDPWYAPANAKVANLYFKAS